MKILIIEDDPAKAAVLQERLEADYPNDYINVLTADDTQEISLDSIISKAAEISIQGGIIIANADAYNMTGHQDASVHIALEQADILYIDISEHNSVFGHLSSNHEIIKAQLDEYRAELEIFAKHPNEWTPHLEFLTVLLRDESIMQATIALGKAAKENRKSDDSDINDIIAYTLFIEQRNALEQVIEQRFIENPNLRPDASYSLMTKPEHVAHFLNCMVQGMWEKSNAFQEYTTYTEQSIRSFMQDAAVFKDSRLFEWQQSGR